MARVPSRLHVGKKVKPFPADIPAGLEDGDNSRLEKQYATHADTHVGTVTKRQRRDKRGRFGYDRGPRSLLGRFPFVTVSNRYLDALQGHRAEITLRQLRRDLNTIRQDLDALNGIGKVTTTDPERFTVEDIAAIIGYWRTRLKRGRNAKNVGGKLDPTSQTHLWRALKGLLEYAGNGAVGQLKTLPYVELPRTLDKPIDTLTDEGHQRLRVASETIRGWRGTVARFLIDFCPGTGLRPKEVRLQEAACVDLLKLEGLVCHPKGEGRYAAPHEDLFPLTPLAEQALRDFLLERERFLDDESHPALVPFRDFAGTLGYWPDSSLRKIMADLRKASGVQVSLQTCRATFGQWGIDRGAETQDVSRAMRHKTTVTTERYYARVRPKDALARVKEAFGAARLIERETHGIERRRPDSFDP